MAISSPGMMSWKAKTVLEKSVSLKRVMALGLCQLYIFSTCVSCRELTLAGKRGSSSVLSY
jgi:hypothetical protein